MNDPIARARRRLARAWRFFSHEVWEARLSELPSGKAFWYRAARILYCTLRGLIFEETLHVRGAALTYFSVLSLVPLLAFAFALLKGFGAYDVLVEGTLRPYLSSLLEGNAPLQRAFEQLLGFVEQTSVASLGFLGLLFLLYAATRLLRNIEVALNEVWGARSSSIERSTRRRQTTHYDKSSTTKVTEQTRRSQHAALRRTTLGTDAAARFCPRVRARQAHSASAPGPRQSGPIRGARASRCVLTQCWLRRRAKDAAAPMRA